MLKLPSALAEPRKPLRAILVAWLLCLGGSLLLSAVSQVLVPDMATPQFPKVPPGVLIFMLVVFAPVVETFIMAALLELMLRLRIPSAAAVVLSALGWGVAHSLQAPMWGFVIWWPFLIFSTLFVTWRARSVLAALAMASAAHALHNLVPALMLVAGLSR